MKKTTLFVTQRLFYTDFAGQWDVRSAPKSLIDTFMLPFTLLPVLAQANEQNAINFPPFQVRSSGT